MYPMSNLLALGGYSKGTGHVLIVQWNDIRIAFGGYSDCSILVFERHWEGSGKVIKSYLNGTRGVLVWYVDGIGSAPHGQSNCNRTLLKEHHMGTGLVLDMH